jgi:NitT/TauT family transport system permease protein
MVALQASPKIALAPLLLTWVGFGVRIEVFMGVLIGIFPVIVNTMAGLDTLSSDLAALGRSMRAKPLRMFMRVRLPHALPHIISGLKTASVLTIVGVVVGEFTGSNSGLGYLVLSASSNFDMPYVFSALIFLTIGSLALFYAISIVESRVAWYRQDGGQAAGSPA